MLIDYLHLRLELVRPDGSYVLPMTVIERIRSLVGRIVAISPEGEEEWTVLRWESVRSDSHQLVVRVTDRVEIKGSPARVGGKNNVFGSADILDCFRRMVRYASSYLDVDLPLLPEMWSLRRIDITANYDLGSPAVVRQALLFLKQAEGGHYQTSTSSETIYWNQRSRLRSAKAYHKGPHLRYQLKKLQAEATPAEVAYADRLLRLELKLGPQWFREQGKRRPDLPPWYGWQVRHLRREFDDYFRPLVGNLMVKDMSETALFEEVLKAAPTAGRGRAAWGTYQRVKHEGYRQVQETVGRATWYNHKKILLRAGISLAQLQSPTVVPLVRHRVIELGHPVCSWEELAQRAGKAA